MKKILFTILAVVALNANATVYNETTNQGLDGVFLDAGYSRVDTTTGLEWLSFKNDETAYTLSYSINEMTSWYADQGWILATETQVTDLFDLFFTDFGATGGGTQTITPEDPDNVLIQSRNSWILGFGHDAFIAEDGTVTFNEGSLWSGGLYLTDSGDIGIAGIELSLTADKLNLITTLYGPGHIDSSFTVDTWDAKYGVFMVRDAGVVPIPAAIWLFGTGLIALLGIARRKV